MRRFVELKGGRPDLQTSTFEAPIVLEQAADRTKAPLFTDAYDAPPAKDPVSSEPRASSAILGRLFGSKLIAGVYDWLTDHTLWKEQNLGLLDHLELDALKDPKLLDLGAGTGVGTLALAQALKGRGEVTGLDFAAPMVELANKQARAPNLQFKQGDATNLTDFASGSLDAVVANSFLYLVPDALGALREARRVLRPGGRLVFMEPREEAGLIGAAQEAVKHSGELLKRPYAASRLVAAMVAWRTMSGLEGRRTEGQLRALFSQAGFERVRFEPTLGGLGHYVIAE